MSAPGSFSGLRINIKVYHVLMMILFLFLTCEPVFPAPSTENESVIGAGELMASEINIFLITSGAVAVLILLVTFFSYRIRRLRTELREGARTYSDKIPESAGTVAESPLKPEDKVKDGTKAEDLSGLLLKSIDQGICYFDTADNLQYANDAVYSLTGIEKSSDFRKEFIAGLHPEHNDYQARRDESLAREGSFSSDISLRHRDGNYIILSTRSSLVKNSEGKQIGYMTVMQDITNLKKDMEEMVRHNLESEAGNRLKAGFLANISHEIRTPLNSVVGFANLLLEDNLSRETKEEYVEHINYNSEKLLQIIGDIIDLSRLSSSQIEITYEEASLSALVHDVMEETKVIIRRTDKPIILTVNNKASSVNDLIFTDKIWLKRVLSHLMDNAVKFTLDGSIELMYSIENNDIVFTVKDTGIGINKENLARIFNEFSQEVGGHHRPFEGLGVGLTLAKEVVERMGGRISVRSEKGIGSEFSFNIPYRPAGTKLKRALIPEDQLLSNLDWRKHRCLLVDDNKDVLIYLNRILVDTGITILTARSGVEALDHIRNDKGIDVVILDMQMPEMNGIEATKEIKKIRSDLPIIAQTAFVFENDTDIILEAGCDACLIKPIRREHLITVMSSFIKPG